MNRNIKLASLMLAFVAADVLANPFSKAPAPASSAATNVQGTPGTTSTPVATAKPAAVAPAATSVDAPKTSAQAVAPKTADAEPAPEAAPKPATARPSRNAATRPRGNETRLSEQRRIAEQSLQRVLSGG